MLQDFAKLLDAKLEQKFTSFKRSFGEKDDEHAIEIKKLKSQVKTSSFFQIKGNQFSTSIFDHVESCCAQLLGGNFIIFHCFTKNCRTCG